MKKLCPCGSEASYEKCCKPYHDDTPPESALKLMKSRYSAYSLGKVDYIYQTMHPNNTSLSQSKEIFLKDAQDFAQSTSFNGLTIQDFQEKDSIAFVTFTASLSTSGQDTSFTEKSRFEKLNGKWLYESGEILQSSR